MCGIVGIVGTEFKINELVDDLQKLEYRGYDSAGIAYIYGDTISVTKSLGRIKNLKEKIRQTSYFVCGNCSYKMGDSWCAQRYQCTPSY